MPRLTATPDKPNAGQEQGYGSVEVRPVMVMGPH
jgi:hypothetical protein